MRTMTALRLLTIALEAFVVVVNPNILVRALGMAVLLLVGFALACSSVHTETP